MLRVVGNKQYAGTTFGLLEIPGYHRHLELGALARLQYSVSQTDSNSLVEDLNLLEMQW